MKSIKLKVAETDLLSHLLSASSARRSSTWAGLMGAFLGFNTGKAPYANMVSFSPTEAHALRAVLTESANGRDPSVTALSAYLCPFLAQVLMDAAETLTK